MIRVLAAFALAVAVTLGLFYLMQSLITGGEGAMSEPPKGSMLDFVRVKPEELVQEKDRKPKRPPEPEQAPPDLPQPQFDPAVTDIDGQGFDFSTQVSGDTALTRGIEGYVVVEFTVTKLGTVRDPRVVEAQPEGIFDQAAMDAVLKFKYKPRVVNGDTVEVEGVQNRLTFELGG
jgi:protein TonB